MEQGDIKDQQIRELNLLRDSANTLLKNNDLAFEMDEYQDHEGDDSMNSSPMKRYRDDEVIQDNSMCVLEDNDL